jgi:DNA-binding MarR family transcriptional regulator
MDESVFETLTQSGAGAYFAPGHTKASGEWATLAPAVPVNYQALAAFRFLLGGFLEFSEEAAREVGLPPRQYQALLQIKGLPEGQKMTVGTLAERLRVRHHSAVELADRLEQAGLLTRIADKKDRRRVFLGLTARAEALLAGLARVHQGELHRLRLALAELLEKISP